MKYLIPEKNMDFWEKDMYILWTFLQKQHLIFFLGI